MLDNFHKVEERLDKTDLVLQKDAKNTVDGICKQQGNFKENWNAQNQKQTVEISGTHEKRGLGEFAIFETY